MSSLTHLLASSLIRIWLATSTHSWRRLPRPRDEPVVHAPGANPDRLLVIGSGAVVGYGVLSYDLSVSGQLARQVAATTGRGVDLRVIAHPDLHVRAATNALAEADLASYDVIVVTVGSLDALELLPNRAWRAQMGLLLDTIAAGTRGGLAVLLLAIPQLTELVTVPRLYRAAVGRRCDALNRESALLATTRPWVTFVPFAPPPIDLMENASRDIHIVWARIIAPSVVSALAR